MPRGDFFGTDRCEIGHRDAPIVDTEIQELWEEEVARGQEEEVARGFTTSTRSKDADAGTSEQEEACSEDWNTTPEPKPVNLWAPGYATPTVRHGDYLVSRARYGKPSEVWKAALSRGRGFTFDLGADRQPEREEWRVYAPATAHEKRTRANGTARAALVRWFGKPKSPGARSAFLSEAVASVQFRRLIKRYGLDGRQPMKLEDLAKEEGVTISSVQNSLAKAIESLPVLSTAAKPPGLRAVALETVSLAEQRKFVGENILEDTALPESQGEEAYTTYVGRTERRALGSMIKVTESGTSWSSDAEKRPSLMDAYTDGWIARFEEAKDTSCPFRNRKLRKKWHQGYREAAQELASRREADISTS